MQTDEVPNKWRAILVKLNICFFFRKLMRVFKVLLKWTMVVWRGAILKFRNCFHRRLKHLIVIQRSKIITTSARVLVRMSVAIFQFLCVFILFILFYFFFKMIAFANVGSSLLNTINNSTMLKCFRANEYSRRKPHNCISIWFWFDLRSVLIAS